MDIRKLITVVVFALLASTFSSGCGSSRPSPTPNTGESPSTSDGQQPAADESFLLIQNNSAEPIFYIYMSSSQQTTWGNDLLGPNQVLAVGETFTVTGITPGLWDVRVQDQSGNYKEYYRQQVGAGQIYTLEIDSKNWMR